MGPDGGATGGSWRGPRGKQEVATAGVTTATAGPRAASRATAAAAVSAPAVAAALRLDGLASLLARARRKPGRTKRATLALRSVQASSVAPIFTKIWILHSISATAATPVVSVAPAMEGAVAATAFAAAAAEASAVVSAVVSVASTGAVDAAPVAGVAAAAEWCADDA